QPLPGESVSAASPLPTRTGGAPPPSTDAGNPCPSTAVQHSFDISAAREPNGSNASRYVYVPTSKVANVLAGTLHPEPLVMHVRVGDCVTVNFWNQTKTSVGFHLSGLDSGVASSGVDVGWNPSTTVADGQRQTYRYYVGDPSLAGGVIGDLAGLDTAKGGLYGAYTVEPKGSVSTDSKTGAKTDVGSAVDVSVPGGQSYRDFTLAMADDERQLGSSFMPYPINAEKPTSDVVKLQAGPARREFGQRVQLRSVR
ncbi:MAG: hypothetical protein ABJA93_13915, partial [Sporichthyaceae bacterium]